jgi:hypothetical protein
MSMKTFIAIGLGVVLVCGLAFVLAERNAERQESAARAASASAADDGAASIDRAWPPQRSIEENLAGLKAADEKTRVRAVQALGGQTDATNAEKAIAALIEALGAGPGVASEQSRAVAAMSLGKHGPRAAPAVPTLVEALAAPKLRDVSIDALGKIGAEAKSAVPALVRILESPEERVATRRLAAQALGAIAPFDAGSVTALELALEDPDRRIQHAAREALKR